MPTGVWPLEDIGDCVWWKIWMGVGGNSGKGLGGLLWLLWVDCGLHNLGICLQCERQVVLERCLGRVVFFFGCVVSLDGGSFLWCWWSADM